MRTLQEKAQYEGHSKSSPNWWYCTAMVGLMAMLTSQSQSQSQRIMRRALVSAYHAYRLLLGGRGKDKGCVCVGVYMFV